MLESCAGLHGASLRIKSACGFSSCWSGPPVQSISVTVDVTAIWRESSACLVAQSYWQGCKLAIQQQAS